MRNRRLVRLVGVPLTAALTLAGCSGGDGGDDTAGGGKVTLKIIGWKGSAAEPAKMKEINAAFEAAHPNIKIDYTIIPAGDTYEQKLNSEFLSGEAEDVIMSMPKDALRWSKSGYLLDLAGEPWISDLAPNAKAMVTGEGKVVAQPSELTNIGLYSNMRILKSAGITKPPATWPEFLAALNTLKKANKPGLALPNKDGWTVWTAIVAAAGAQVYKKNPNWNADLAAGRANFVAEPGWKTAMQRMNDLGAQGLIDYKAQLGVDEWSQGTQDFKAGKSAFFFQGSWAMGDLAKGVSEIELSPWPGGDAGDPGFALAAGGTTWTINSKSSKKTAAKEYLKYWATSAALTPYLTAEGASSPFKSVPSPAIPNAKSMTTAVSESRFHIFAETTWASGSRGDEMKSAVQAMLLGKKSVDQTLAAFDTASKS